MCSSIYTLSAAQSQTILRFLFGALAEAWEMIRRPVNQKLIGTDYIKIIEEDGVAVYDQLNKHFGTTNLLHKIRNTLAYHHPSAEVLQAAFEGAPEDEAWVWYPADTIDNSFYLVSDAVISNGIRNATDEVDTIEAYKKVLGVVVPVSNDMIDFLNFLMRAIVVRHLGQGALSLRDKVEVSSALRRDDVSIPFFTIDDEQAS